MRPLVPKGILSVRQIPVVDNAKRKIEFVKKSAGTEKRNREIGSFFSLCAMGALTGARPERAQIAGSGWQAYGEKGIYKCTFHDIENSATGGKK